MNKRINALTIVCLSVLALVVSSCSSKSETPETPADDADVLPYSDGAPSNTGIATMPRASTVPLTEQRPVLIDLDYLTDANGFSTRVSSADEEFGRELYALGDINGDALPDFSFSTDKQTTVVFGSSSKLSDINLDDLDDASGLVLEGAYSFQGVGDLNNDGIDDLGISGSTSELFPSMVRIVFGRSDGELKRALLETVPGVDGVDIYNSAMADQFRSITSAGDFNNDGIDDLLIGGYARFDVNHTAANAWVIYGHADIGLTESLDVTSMSIDQGLLLFSPLTQSQADAVYEDQVDGGYDATVAGGFDLNADGIDDIALGSHLYDFELEMGESRTFVVYGSNTRSTDAIDLTMLDGENGFRITSGLQPFASDPDRVESVGDIDANGFNDLSLNNDGNGILIVFSGKHDGAAVVDSSSLPTGMAMQIQDSAEPSQYSLTAIKVGDIDNDGIDDLGVLKPSGDAVILYGASDALPDSVDLADPANVELTTIKGLSDGYAWYDGRRLVALGDINTDGADDLGIGWGVRRYVSDIALIDDINEDGIEDLSISGIDTESMYLMRVLYGFPAEGFTGFLAATPNPGPAALIEAEFFDGMVGALDTAAKYAINTLNDNVSNGVDSGPTAAACLSDSSGVETAEIEQFTCSDAPLAIKYEWSGKYASSATALFSSVAYENDTLSVLKFATDPVPNGSPAPGGPSLYSVFVNYDANGVVELTNGVTTEQPLISPISCTIDVASRITSDEPENCMDLIYATTWKMAAVFGENKYVDTLTLLP